MKCLAWIAPLIVMCLQLCNPASCASQEIPEWALREYSAAPTQVFSAALRSIEIQKHEIKSKDEQKYSVDFHVGITAWSWGYNMRLTVTPVERNRSKVVVGVLKSGGNVFSWGSGKKEVRKILGGIDAELASPAVQDSHTSASAANPHQGGSASCRLRITSEPNGADVELDGKFVGQTPAQLRLEVGDHQLAIKRLGYVSWERKISAVADSDLSINAELHKAE